MDEAVIVLRLSRRYLLSGDSRRTLHTVKAGRARRIPADAIAEYVKLLD